MKITHDLITIQNGELFYQTHGEGEAIIFIHAGFSDSREWEYQLEFFKNKFKVLVYDQRGSGKSSIVSSSFSPAQDLKALMDQLNIKKAILVGHSIGGTIALDFSLQYPDKVASLVLIASGLNGYTWSPEYLEFMNKIWINPNADEITKNFLSAPFYSICMQQENSNAQIEMIVKDNIRKFLTWKTFDINDVKWYFPNPLSNLKKLNKQTLLICGDKDSQDIKQILNLLAENLLNSQVEIINHADHFVNYTHQNEVNFLINTFLKSSGRKVICR